MYIAQILRALTILLLSLVVYGQFRYDIEYVEPSIYVKCEDYPDNFIDQVVDMSQVAIEQTEDGNLIMNGPVNIIKTLPNELPVKLETFKRERGTWQPTMFTSKRTSLCKAAFDGSEVWAAYWKNTPKDQQKCPFTEGQRLDLDIKSDTSMNLPMRNVEGEYMTRVEIGDKSDDLFMCADVYINMHKL